MSKKFITNPPHSFYFTSPPLCPTLFYIQECRPRVMVSPGGSSCFLSVFLLMRHKPIRLGLTRFASYKSPKRVLALSWYPRFTCLASSMNPTVSENPDEVNPLSPTNTSKASARYILNKSVSCFG